MPERWTIAEIRRAVKEGRLSEPLRPHAVNAALRITYAGTFLPKHRVGNPGGNTAHFVQIGRGTYLLK